MSKKVEATAAETVWIINPTLLRPPQSSSPRPAPVEWFKLVTITHCRQWMDGWMPQQLHRLQSNRLYFTFPFLWFPFPIYSNKISLGLESTLHRIICDSFWFCSNDWLWMNGFSSDADDLNNKKQNNNTWYAHAVQVPRAPSSLFISPLNGYKELHHLLQISSSRDDSEKQPMRCHSLFHKIQVNGGPEYNNEGESHHLVYWIMCIAQK